MEKEYQKLLEASLDIYFAGHWECDRLSKEESALLFERLRKALGVELGEKLIHLSMGG